MTHLLIYIDELPETTNALRLGVQVAQAAQAQVTLLAVAPNGGAEAEARARLTAAAPKFSAAVNLKVRFGRAAREILAEVESGGYDLVVVRSRGRRGWVRAALGSVSGRVARYSPVPVLVVRDQVPERVQEILACTGGGKPGERVARWGGLLAHWFEADFAILHVMSQMAVATDADTIELIETAEQAMQAHTREGVHLAREIELAQAAGLRPAQVWPKIRHGLVVDEVQAELEEGGYDLLVIGGHHAPGPEQGSGPIRAFLLEDVADQLIADVRLPVLVVKGPV